MTASAPATPPSDTDHFGGINFGYVVIESNRRERWKTFAAEAMGFHVDEIENGWLAFRLDQRERRILVRPGPAEDVVAMGWEFRDDAALTSFTQCLAAQGTKLTAASLADAHQRGVEAYTQFTGPLGLSMECFARARMTNQPLTMKSSGFVTGEQGMGHLSVMTRQPEKLIAEFAHIFGARVSDRITDRIGGVELEVTFLRLNPRHHTFAIAATKGVRLNPIPHVTQHLMVQAASFADVTGAYQRCKKLGFKIAMGVGQHPNDNQISFYVISPSGFEMEMGFDPITVNDEASWQVKDYRGISAWGHFPEGITRGDRMRQKWTAIKSLFQPMR